MVGIAQPSPGSCRLLAGSLPLCCGKVLPQCQALSQVQLVPPAERLRCRPRSMLWKHRVLRCLLVGTTAGGGAQSRAASWGKALMGVLGLQPTPHHGWVKATLPGRRYCCWAPGEREKQWGGGHAAPLLPGMPSSPRARRWSRTWRHQCLPAPAPPI